jgi:hypothetical protein
MSSDLRRKTSGRKAEPKNQFLAGSHVSVEDNLGKLGFLAEPKKKSSKSDRSKVPGFGGLSDSQSKTHPHCFQKQPCFKKHYFLASNARHINLVLTRLPIKFTQFPQIWCRTSLNEIIYE